VSENGGSTYDDWSYWGIGLGCFFIVAAGVATCGWLNKKSKREKTVRQQIVAIENRLRKVEAEIPKLESRVNAPLNDNEVVEFQSCDVSQLLERKKERDAFILDFQQKNSLPPDEFVQSMGGTRNLNSSREMSVEVQELARHANKKISAIMLYRAETGASLAEAKAAVEAFAMGNKQ
jgi:ribosomal protein L7/L12